MKNAFRTCGRLLLVLGLAFALTVGSVLIQELGPEMSVFGNLCGPTRDELCYEPTLRGGFPFAYLYDRPGLSVEHQLFLEDDFRGVWFVADWLIYGVLITLAKFAIRRLGRRSA